MELPKCEICGIRPVYYNRVRYADDTTHTAFAGIRVCSSDDLIEVVQHACGGSMIRDARRDFNQPEGGNNFISFREMGPWEIHKECPEAARLLREMRGMLSD